ncbi:MAG: molybdopterin cofactor-binding domain-containing protein [Novosphingobium sp.]
MRLTRRGLLVGAAAGGALVVAWGLNPRRYPSPLRADPGETAVGAWLKLGDDGVVTVAVPQLEMGQGIATLIPQTIAHELGADWRRIAVEPAALSGAYANAALAAKWAELWMPVFAGAAETPGSLLALRFAQSATFTATADGMSLAAYERGAREAGAAARTMLAQAAADRWGVDWEECAAENGFIVHGKNRLAFADLARDAADYDPPDPPVLRADPPAERAADALPGAKLRYPRLDLPAKVDGSAQFAGDIRLPDMVFAAIRHSPTGDGKLARYAADKAKAVPGFLRLVEGADWLAAAASDWWAAERALLDAAPQFKVAGPADSGRIAKALDRALTYGDARDVHAAGETPGNFHFARRYSVAPALHAALETASVTARVGPGKCELWVATQAPEAARRAAAEVLGIAAEDVVLYPVPAGGSFDRRLEHRHVAEAAAIARTVGKPVQLTWSRWQEHLAGLPRPPVEAALAAQLDTAGSPVSWKARIALPAAGREFGRRLFDGDAPRAAMLASAGEGDAPAVEGAAPPYSVPNLLIQHVPASIGLPVGRMRANAHGYTAFFTECFIDELARNAGREPLSYRIGLLAGDLRLAECLQRAATLAEWNGGAPGSGEGLACHRMQAGGRWGRIAAVAKARRDESGIRVDSFYAVVDIGRIVNLDIARQQIEGGLLYGMGLALGSSSAWAKGRPQAERLGQLNLPRLATAPEIEIDFVEGEAAPFDPGELGVAVAAPAIANALFAATGERFRTLPLNEAAA